MYDFSNRLKHLREIGGLNQLDVANRIGSTKSTISRYENNLMTPTLDVAVNLAKTFGVTLDWLAGYGELSQFDDNIPGEYVQIAEELYKNEIPVEKARKMIEILKG